MLMCPPPAPPNTHTHTVVHIHTHTHTHACTHTHSHVHLNALFRGSFPQVRILEEAGQLPLAYVSASTHGLLEEAERISQGLSELPDLAGEGQMMQPPTPILKEDNWPLLMVSKVSRAPLSPPHPPLIPPPSLLPPPPPPYPPTALSPSPPPPYCPLPFPPLPYCPHPHPPYCLLPLQGFFETLVAKGKAGEPGSSKGQAASQVAGGQGRRGGAEWGQARGGGGTDSQD